MIVLKRRAAIKRAARVDAVHFNQKSTIKSSGISGSGAESRKISLTRKVIRLEAYGIMSLPYIERTGLDKHRSMMRNRWNKRGKMCGISISSTFSDVTSFFSRIHAILSRIASKSREYEKYPGLYRTGSPQRA